MPLEKKKYLFASVIFLIVLNFNISKGIAEQNKSTPSCEINNSTINCYNMSYSEVFKVSLFSNPFRIQFNFKNNLLIKKHKRHNNKFIKSFRFNKSSKSQTLLVLEFKKPTIVSDIRYHKINEKSINLSMYLTNTSTTNYAIAKHALNKNNGDIYSLVDRNKILSKNINISPKKNDFQTIKIKSFKKTKSMKKFVVFIDPGHGGKDPGAIGQLGTLEKNITLKASILLAKSLRKNNKIIPILSRNKDIYLSLRKRTILAKENKADIFISLHADSSKNKRAKGISVFSLSNKASDKEAQLLAKRENEVDNFLGNDEKIEDPLIYGTLIKMYQRAAMNDSALLAKHILLNLEKTQLAVNRGHRFAGFSVLKSYEIPSILIEIGFLSNKQEEKKLLNPIYLEELAKGLAISIENYLSNYEK